MSIIVQVVFYLFGILTLISIPMFELQLQSDYQSDVSLSWEDWMPKQSYKMFSVVLASAYEKVKVKRLAEFQSLFQGPIKQWWQEQQMRKSESSRLQDMLQPALKNFKSFQIKLTGPSNHIVCYQCEKNQSPLIWLQCYHVYCFDCLFQNNVARLTNNDNSQRMLCKILCKTCQKQSVLQQKDRRRLADHMLSKIQYDKNINDKCTSHKGQLVLYCQNCSQPICDFCGKNHHKLHQKIKIQAGKDDATQRLHQLLNIVNQEMEKFRGATISDFFKVKEIEGKTKEHLQELFSKLYSLVEQTEDRILKQYEQVFVAAVKSNLLKEIMTRNQSHFAVVSVQKLSSYRSNPSQFFKKQKQTTRFLSNNLRAINNQKEEPLQLLLNKQIAFIEEFFTKITHGLEKIKIRMPKQEVSFISPQLSRETSPNIRSRY